jgi:hypothetical protein
MTGTHSVTRKCAPDLVFAVSRATRDGAVCPVRLTAESVNARSHRDSYIVLGLLEHREIRDPRLLALIAPKRRDALVAAR